ncbi:MAG: hypothetical protein PWQ79_1524 [Thermococcaceae archaeon]|nr:hypothetical protein [Thermococcaceae archaeon]MDK2914609.1 hypothetical protein [Thermococcaceae archaeon]
MDGILKPKWVVIKLALAKRIMSNGVDRDEHQILNGKALMAYADLSWVIE